MEIVALSMAATCFVFGLIAITRVDGTAKEDQRFIGSLRINDRSMRSAEIGRAHV
jgi:hypothetical protein